MKIGVISDTHLTEPSGVIETVAHTIRNKLTLDDLRKVGQQYFYDVDLIIHAGDFVELSVFRMLQEFAPVEAVQGNMDTTEIRTEFPDTKVLDIGGFKIGLTHGDGAPRGIIERVKRHFREDMDVIVFGHTHQPLNEILDGILFFNPGSPTDRIFAPYNSVGILELSDTINGQIIRL